MNPTPLYLGADVSKGYIDLIVLNGQGEAVCKPAQLYDTPAGHEALYQLLSNLSQASAGQIYAGVESTGGYENNWFHSLTRFSRSLPLSVARLNPAPVKASEDAHFHRNKTDKSSAYAIANYLMRYGDQVKYGQADAWKELRQGWSFIRLMSKQKTQLINHMEKLVYTANPVMIPYMKKGLCKWHLTLLKQYPSADKLSRARCNTLAKIPYVNLQRATELIQAAKESIGHSSPLNDLLIAEIAGQIEQKKQVIDQHIAQLEAYCPAQDIELLCSFPGISTRSAVGLLVEIGNIERFDSAKKLAAYWGVHPVYQNSGDGKAGYRMAKKGRAAPRAILFNIALSAINHNPIIKELYQKKQQEGMTNMAAMGLCMHKVLRIVYGMLKYQTRFDPLIDQRNKQRNDSLKNEEPKAQEALPINAPVSYKKTRNVKKQTMSQLDDSSNKYGIMTAPQTNNKHYSPKSQNPPNIPPKDPENTAFFS